MWTPPINFITLHYTYIIFSGIISLIIIYPYGNLRAIDAYFFGVSASTESGLNTVDVKALKTYQQLVIYFIPIITNAGFVNIIVVIIRLQWFEKRFKNIAPKILGARRRALIQAEDEGTAQDVSSDRVDLELVAIERTSDTKTVMKAEETLAGSGKEGMHEAQLPKPFKPLDQSRPRIVFAPDPRRQRSGDDETLYIPSPKARELGHPFVEVVTKEELVDADDEIEESIPGPSKRREENDDTPLRLYGRSIGTSKATSIEQAASSMFVLGPERSRDSSRRRSRSSNRVSNTLPALSAHATVGRNSEFRDLSAEDRQLLGGIEYRALRLLLKIVLTYFFGLQLFCGVALAGWIEVAPAKYRQYLQSQGQNKTWWAFYSASTMSNNLGFTLTPDSMISFRDATFPMLLMTFTAYAGHTFYPIFLRLTIWSMSKMLPRASALQEPIHFLLEHPRRCYTLLFPSRATWALFGILFALNFVDIVLIVCLDLHNDAVNTLPLGPRIVASIFQAASSRHTGTAVFNLADVNPAVQFSLLVMMYIAVFPISISIRSSNTYEERSLGIYPSDAEAPDDGKNSKSYLLSHLQNQLSFDLWYIFLGIFCICIAEADRVMDPNDPAFAIFPIFFEVVSAYGNVGLSLGYPSNLTSLCGHFSTFSKLVICAMMIRGRHRMLPYALDRAIVLPSEAEFGGDYSDETKDEGRGRVIAERDFKIKRHHTT